MRTFENFYTKKDINFNSLALDFANFFLIEKCLKDTKQDEKFQNNIKERSIHES